MSCEMAVLTTKGYPSSGEFANGAGELYCTNGSGQQHRIGPERMLWMQ